MTNELDRLRAENQKLREKAEVWRKLSRKSEEQAKRSHKRAERLQADLDHIKRIFHGNA